MIIYHSFGVSVEEYAAKGRENLAPIIEGCLNCNARARLRNHGYYMRYALEGEVVYRLCIRRLKCVSCRKTFSLLPDFLIPQFQSTFLSILRTIKDRLSKQKSLRNRQRSQFYMKRFMQWLTRTEMFFRSQDDLRIFPVDSKEKTTNAVQLILDFGESTFLRRFRGQFATSFMARSFYQIFCTEGID